MNKTDFKGIYPVLSLPFTKDKDIDYDSLSNLVNFCYKKGAKGIVIYGVASEFYKVTDEESREIIKAIIAENNKRMHFIVSVGKLCTETTIMQARFCNNLDVDGLMIVPPYFLPVSQKSLFEHYLNVANSVDLPIIIQDAPQNSGVNMDMDFYTKLAESAGNINYAKIEAPFSGPKMESVISATGGKIRIIDGYGGNYFYEHLLRGACALMPGCTLVDRFADIYNKFEENKKDKAIELHTEILPLINLECQGIGEFFVACEKLMLKHLGVIRSSASREPWTTLDKTTENLVIEYLDRLILK